MVVYTPAAAKTSTSIISEIQLAVDQTNNIYANSNIRQRLRLVHTEQVSYTEIGKGDLGRLRNTKDGFLDEVHKLRDNHKADLVSLWVEEDKSSYGGIGSLMNYNSPSRNFERYGFSITKRRYATAPSYTFVHELGHNMAAHHDKYAKYQGKSNGCQDGMTNCGYIYGTGDRDTSWKTIMSYPTKCREKGYYCRTIPYFSNPDIEYDGVATGNNYANNALVLNNTADIVASFRESAEFLTEDTKIFTVYNDGDADLIISAISLENNALRGVTVRPTTATIVSGKSVVITVKLDYSKVPTGQTNNRLLISSNDPNNTAYPINIVINRQTDSGANVAADSYDADLNELSLTASAFGGIHQATLNPIELLPEIVGSIFNLEGSIEVFGEFLDEQLTTYDPETGIVQIPIGSTYLASGEPILFVVEMQETSSGIFEVTNFTIIPVQAIE